MTPARPVAQYLHGQPVTAIGLVQTLLAPGLAVLALFFSTLAFGQPMEGASLLLAVLTFALAFPGRIPRNGGRLGLAISILVSWGAILGFLFMLGWASHNLDHFDPRVVWTWAVLTPLLQFMAQRLLYLTLPLWMALGGGPRPVVIVGRGFLSRQLVAAIEGSPLLGLHLAGYFDDRVQARVVGEAQSGLLGSLSQLAAYVKTHPGVQIYITLPMASQPRILRLLDELRDTTASVYFTPDIFVTDLIQARVDTVGGMPVVAICETPHYGISGPLKRASDLLLAGLILILIAPLLLVIALAIRVQSPGPVIFRQRRYGLDGREIVVYKFRSMTVTEDGGVIRQACRDDSRVTPLGAFLRRTSLDELPQFFNVLQGTMSVVGPRPHAIAHNEQYRKLINGYMLRHKVKPGITGWAQVNGLRGETDTLDKMQKRIDYDLAYLRNWSLGWDLEIVLRTLFVVWKKQNAY